MSEWRPKENYETNGTEVIAWVSSNKGFEDITAKLIYIDTGEKFKDIYPVAGWYWSNSEEPVKRPDLINGVIKWPDPPKSTPE